MNGSIITIDTNDHIHLGDVSWSGALVSIDSLKYGDLKVLCPDGKTILIERKTPRDFLDSIKDGRLMNQVVGLVEGGDFAYIVITGIFEFVETRVIASDGNEFNREYTNWNWHSLQGILLSIQELGCGIIYDPDYVGAVERLINRSRNASKIPARREAYVFSPKENFLASLPGIGHKRAEEILKVFGDNLGIALEWLSKPGEFEPRIKGISSGLKQKVNEFLGGAMEVKL